MRILRWILIGLGGLAVLVTVLPFIPSNESAIRIWDFPRVQVVVLLAAVLIATPFVLPLAVMRALSEEGMTMVVVTHEMAFARNVSDEVVFIDQGVVVERQPPNVFFARPETARARQFLSRYT